MIAALWIIGALALVLLGYSGWGAWSLRNAHGDAYIGKAELVFLAFVVGLALVLVWCLLAYLHWRS